MPNDSTMKFRADISQLKAAMQQASRAIRVANSEFKASTAGMDKWSTSADGLRAKLKQLNTVLKSQKTQLSLAEQELEKTRKVYGENSAETDRAVIQVNKYKAAIAKTEADLRKYDDALEQVEHGSKDVANAVEDSGEAAQRAKDGFTVMKGALASLVADGIRLAIRGVKELARETFNAGANFEAAMSQVEAVSGASGSEMEELTAKAKEMGEKTKFSATESAEAFNYMAMAGWKTGDMLGGIEGIMNLAAASGADLATTSDIVTDALTGMGYSAADSGHLADVMAAASSNANTNVEMMGATFQYAAPLVGALGYTMEDTAVAIGLMANAGIKADKAGTSLRSIFSRLASPPKAAAEAIDELGISLTDSSGKMKPFQQIMVEMREKFSGLSETEKTAAASAIAGKNAMSGLLAIVNAAPTDFDKLTKAVNNSEGAAQEMADTMNDNVSGQITLLKSKVEGIMIKVFEAAAPRIRKAIDSISAALDNVDWNAVAADVGDAVGTVVDVFKWLLQNGRVVAAVLKTVAVALTGIFVTNKVAIFATSISTLHKAFTGLKTAQEGATIASKALGLATKALPFVGVAAVIGGITAALIHYSNKQKEAARNQYALTKSQREAVNAVKEDTQSIKELNKTRDEAVAAANGEYNYIYRLKNEYNSLVDANGKVTGANKDRAEFILNTLAKSMGVERSEIDKLINKNGQLSNSIDKLIEKQRAQAILNANEEKYNTAIQNRDAALEKYGNALRTLDQTEANYKKTQEASANVMNRYKELLATNSDAAERYYRSHQDVIIANESAKASYDKANSAVKQAQKNYLDYNTTIQNYEGLSSAIISGDSKKISTALGNMKNAFVTSNNGTKQILQQQVKDFEDKYYNLKAAVQAGMPGVTQEEVKQAKNMVDQAKKEFDKFEKEGKSAGEKGGKAFADGVGSKTKNAKTQGQKAGKAAKTGVNSGSSGMKKTGQKRGGEFASGVGSKKKAASSSGSSLGKNAKSGASSGGSGMGKSGQRLGAAFATGVGNKKGSAKTEGTKLGKNANSGADSYKGEANTSGGNFSQGFINGIGSLVSSAFDKAKELAKKAWAGLKKGQAEGSPSKLTYQSGVYFVQGYINGIVSEQKTLVTTVQNMVASVVSELGKMSGFNFTAVAANATSNFAAAMNKQSEYMIGKMQYQNESKLKDFDKTIAKIQSKQNKKSAKLQKASDKKIAKLEKKRDKKVRALEKKRNKLGDSKSAKKQKKKLTAQIKSVKNSAAKSIKAEKASAKKQINSSNKTYEKQIKTQEKYKDAYQNASSAMMSEFQNAMNEYQQNAQALIDDTINGITDRYNQRYDELIGKQDSLIEKLKGAGELFEISGAGVMTVNDLKEQTKAITDYTDKLQKIKAKVSGELFDQIVSYDMTEGSAFMDRLLEMSASDLDAYNKAYTEKMEAARKAGESIYKADFNKIASDYKNEINKAFKDLPGQLEVMGKQSMQGFIDGFGKNTDYMSKEIKTFVNGMIGTFKKELGIKSPSKVMFSIGEFTGEGLDNGLMSMLKKIQGTAGDIASALASPIDSASVNLNGVRASVNGAMLGANSSSVVNNYNLVQNNTSPKSLSALETYQARRRQISMMKAATGA